MWALSADYLSHSQSNLSFVSWLIETANQESFNFREELLEVHENEANRLKEYYEANKRLFTKVQERQTVSLEKKDHFFFSLLVWFKVCLVSCGSSSTLTLEKWVLIILLFNYPIVFKNEFIFYQLGKLNFFFPAVHLTLKSLNFIVLVKIVEIMT